MSNNRTAPIRPSVAKLLKRQIGGFVKAYDRELNRPAEPAKPKSAAREPAADPSVQPGEPTTVDEA